MKNTRFAFALAVSLLTTASLIPSIAHATSFITEVGTGGTTQTQGGIDDNDTTIGWRITVGAQALSLTDLGAWDAGGDGLESATLVGVWQTSDQTLLASGTVPAGTTPTLADGFRYIHLTTAVTLQANTSYTFGVRLAAGGGTQHEYRFGTNPVYSSAATFQYFGMNNNTPTAAADFSAQMPVNNLGDSTPLDGPNFQFVAIVPEPSTWALLGAGAVGAGVVVLRRRRGLVLAGPDMVSHGPR